MHPTVERYLQQRKKRDLLEQLVIQWVRVQSDDTLEAFVKRHQLVPKVEKR